MRKALRITAATAGIVCAVSSALLALVYMEDFIKYLQFSKTKIAGKARQNRYGGGDVGK